jgi:iron complex outermembrane receptor protein
MNMKRLLLLTAVILLTFVNYAQHSISGTLNDSLAQPIPHAMVRLLETNNVTLTDFHGGFTLENISAGDYTLEMSMIGYKTIKKSIKGLSKNETLAVTLKEDVYNLNQVIVQHTRAKKDAPVAQSTIEYADLEKINLGQDLPILLDNQVSIVTTSDAGAGIGYTGFRIRGSDASRINVTVNGIPINDPESQGVFWVNMPDFTSSIENLQIQRGVGTSTNGAGAFGGTVNMQTQGLQEKAYGELSSSIGSFNTQKQTAKFGTGLINKYWAFDGRISSITSDGYIDRASSDLESYYISGGYYGDKTVVKAIHFAGKEETYQSWWGTPQSRISGKLADMQTHADNDGYSDAQRANLLAAGRTYNHYLYENEVDHYGQDHYQLHLSHQLSKQLTASMAFHYTYGRGYFEQYRNGDDFADYGLSNLVVGGDTITSTDVIRRRWLDNHFYGTTYNLNYTGDKLNLVVGGAYNEYIGDHFGEVNWMEFANGTAIRDRYYDNTGFKTDLNSYLKADYALNDKVVAFADLQVRSVGYSNTGTDNDLRTLSIDTSFVFVNPKAGITIKMNTKTRLYASLSMANREPVRNDFIDNPSNEQPKHEQMIDYEFGMDWKSKKASFQANGYFMDYTNQLVLTGALNDVGSNIRANVNNSYRMGIELSGAAALTKKINFTANATFSQNKIEEYKHVIYDYTNGYDIVETVYKNTDIAFSPNAIAAVGLDYNPIKSLNILIMHKRVGRQFLDNTASENKAIDGYKTFNAKISYSIYPKYVKEIAFSLLVNNVFNEMYSSNGYTYSYIYGDTITENFYYPQAGTNFLGGITMKF